MKMCPNCHRLSKDDDFCSHCGSAVYEDNTDYSIDCSQIPGHTHEKQTFTQNDPRMSQSNQSNSEKSPEVKPKGKLKGCLSVIVFIIILNVLFDIIGAILSNLG
ncbi:MAG: hypothetical protein SOT68_09510 [Oscillospiraceae bacterium]|nr:hypothetical protein [Oscillospiraceae bacterium]MDY2864415.1 hypothetical protein [Oscillospiraceae bacterium]